MIKLAITGGIGSGKSTVARVLEMLGAAIYNSDQRAKELMSCALRAQIIELLGGEAFIGEQLNRPYIAGVVFKDKSLLGKLNEIVHPVVIDDFLQWCDDLQSQGKQVAIIESALVVESGIDKVVDGVIVVICDMNERIARIIKRDGVSEAQALNRINSQSSQQAMLEMADFVVDTTPGVMQVEQIVGLWEKFEGGFKKK